MKIPVVTVLLAAVALSGAANAATESTSRFDGTSFYLGGGAAYVPRYPGSKEYRAAPLLNASVLFKNGFFIDGNQGAGYQLKFSENFYAIAALGLDPGRAEKNDLARPGGDHLRGLGNIKSTALVNAGVGYNFSDRGSVVLELSQPVGHAGYGTTAHLAGHLTAWKGQRDGIDLDAAVHYGDADYNGTWFGVTQAQARRSSFLSYAPGAGIYAVDASVTWSHQFNDHWFTRVTGGATRYMQDVAKSPLVEARTGYIAAASVNYLF